MASGLATLHELQTVYGTEDAFDLLDILTIQRANEQQAAQEMRSTA